MTARVEPPPEHQDKRWHWLCRRGGVAVPARWDTQFGWLPVGYNDWVIPKNAAQSFSYIGPAIPPDEVP